MTFASGGTKEFPRLIELIGSRYEEAKEKILEAQVKLIVNLETKLAEGDRS
jgi:hypothetical protein